jgi:hypothetical protein
MRSLLFVMLIVVALVVAPSAFAQTHFSAVIDGSQVVPPTTSAATGSGCFVLNPDNTLGFQISFTGLVGNETGAHIHGPGPAGVNAGVQFALPLGSPKIGTVGPLTAVQAADLVNGLYYVQIHTDVFPGGEIRGQILLTADLCTVSTEDKSWGAVKVLYR